MKIFPTSMVAQLDEYTIEHEPILSVDLMERASVSIFNWISQHLKKAPMVVFCGSGNNGGDGLALARIAHLNGWEVVVCMLHSERYSNNFLVNLERIKSHSQISLLTITDASDFPSILPNSIVVDGILGSGLTRPASGLWAQLIQYINELNAMVVSIDLPSGLMGEDNSNTKPNCIVKATTTLTFQFPKVAFFMPENDVFVGRWHVLDIGLHRHVIDNTPTPYYYITHDLVHDLLRGRSNFSHKGSYGHALLVAGSYGKMGASVLASRACLKSGVGLLTTHAPRCGYEILQITVPEAMVSPDSHHFFCTHLPNLAPYNAIGIGPGIGTEQKTRKALQQVLSMVRVQRLVLDADALNMMSSHKKLLLKLPVNCILTPHPKEFERLAGSWDNDFERLLLLKKFSHQFQVVVILKGAYTTIAMPNGDCFFNSTGNPGMATAGAGDVLTGVLLALLAQGYNAADAALLGVYLHGLAGDIYANNHSEESLIATDIIDSLAQAFCDIRKVRFYHK